MVSAVEGINLARPLLYHRRMSRKSVTILSSFAVATLAVACSPGSVADVEPPDVERVECTSEFEVTGTFASSVTPRPTAADGCVPEGTWTINLEEVAGGECASTKAQAQYVVVVAKVGAERRFTLSNAMGTAERRMDISGGGNGECEMIITEISPATSPKYHHLAVKPFTEAGGTAIAGSATYTLWTSKP